MDKPKDHANVILKEGAEPITVNGISIVGHANPVLRFPSLEKQAAGWCSTQAHRIVASYGDRYELIEGGCNCNA